MIPELERTNQQYINKINLEVQDVLEGLTDAQILSLKASLTIKAKPDLGTVNNNNLKKDEKTKPF